MRNSYFDNLKFILISCVVSLHFLETFRTETTSFCGGYLFLGSFTMPAFALVSGFFSKRYTPRLKDLSILLLPYLVFQSIYIFYYQWLALDKNYWTSGWSFTMPFIQNWYLLSLLAWRLMSIYARRLKHMIPLTVILGLLAGFEPKIGWEFSLSRTICFFPFFLLGMQLNDEGIERICRFRVLGWIVLMGGAAFSVALSYFAPAKANILIWNILYATPYGSPVEVVHRIVSYGFSMVAILGVLAVIPQRKTWYTRFGERTMSVYMLHIFFALGFEKIYNTYRPIWTELIVVGCSVGVALLLSLKPVFNGLMFPFIKLNALLELKSKKESTGL